MALRDIPKLGVMMLRKGVFDGTRILSQEYVVVDPRTIGQGEQIICVTPSLDLVFAAVSSFLQARGSMRGVLKRFSDGLLKLIVYE